MRACVRARGTDSPFVHKISRSSPRVHELQIRRLHISRPLSEGHIQQKVQAVPTESLQKGPRRAPEGLQKGPRSVHLLTPLVLPTLTTSCVAALSYQHLFVLSERAKWK